MLPFDFSQPLVIFAPMAGYSDTPTREIVSYFGVDAVVSEMMACSEWKTGKAGVEQRAIRGHLQNETKFIVQIAGRDPKMFAEVACFVQDLGADMIDINMGCPAKNVVSGATAGAALLLEPKLACSIIEATSEATKLPVSVKTRLGWSELGTKQFIADFENAGAQMFTIHGRTRAQKYRGAADWIAVKEIRDVAKVPVIVNGDIIDSLTARRALLQSQCMGLMIGRAAIGRPNLVGSIRGELSGHQIEHLTHSDIVLWHYELLLKHYGIEKGVKCARKHLKAYYSDAPAIWLKELLLENNHSEVIRNIKQQRRAA